MTRSLRNLPPAFWGLIAVGVLAAFTQPQFLSLPFLMILLRQAASIGIVALGQTFVVANRSLDLSVGANIAFVNLILAHAMWSGYHPFVAIVVALAAGTFIGFANGVLVTKLRASAVVVTLGTAAIITGIGFLYTGGAPGSSISDLVKWLGRGRVGIVPVAGLVWLGFAIAAFIIMRRLALGRFIYAAGDNPFAALFSGLPVDRTLLASHTLCGFFAASGGVLLSGLIGVGSINLGADYVLSSITAVILGGAVFGGGAGGAVGTVLGTALLVTVLNLLTVFGVGEPGKLIMQGLVIAAAAIIYQQGRRNG
ncbi:ABC transporter permease [Hoeflea poritis]|uniref:ABC transporter permease n=1 Tax=Hoeflea poritis TaxID=2993659 RepID=A0ABT4VUW5_9HYPH|nr:ABC transporter permease [Hoeflea poritis]MDA4848489.1 ABC transporter permease [Hoeflea poritis]